MIRGEYLPARARGPSDAREALAQAVVAGTLTADDLLRRYCALVDGQTGSYVETARRLGIDRRTVKGKLVDAHTTGARATGRDGPSEHHDRRA
jgi:hypothetical protein